VAAHQHQERSSARRKALQILFQSGITGLRSAQIINDGLYIADELGLPCSYTCQLLAGVEEHAEEIDELIAETSQNWSLVRMPLVDRSILRLAIYELRYVAQVPTSVAINEAVELAKNFGGEDESPRFVNGVLGRIASELDKA